MNNSITVGFVFNQDRIDSRANILRCILSSLQLDQHAICIFKACQDINGDEWIYKHASYKNITEEEIKIVTENHYGNILTTTSLLGSINQIIEISIYITSEFFGFLITFFEDKIKKQSEVKTSDLLLAFIKEKYVDLKYEYAFCDQEGVIELSPSEIQDANDYEIFIRAQNDQLIIKDKR